jgi:hypothetical protein
LPTSLNPQSRDFTGTPTPQPGLGAWLIEPAKELATSYTTRRKAAEQGFMEGARQFAPGDGQSADPVNEAIGAAKMLGSGWSYAMAGPAALADTTIGRPVETITGTNRSFAGDALNAASGFVVGAPEAGVAEGAARGAGAEAKGWKVEPPPSAEAFLGPEAGVASGWTFEPPAAGGAPTAADAFLDSAGPKGPVAAAAREDPYDDVLYGPAKAKSAPGGPSEGRNPSLTDTTASAGDALQALFAPATIGLGRDAAGIIRKNAAQGDLMAARAAAALGAHAKAVAELTPDQQLGLIDYLQSRSSGATLRDPKLQAFADTHRRVMQDFEGAISSAMDLGDGESPHFLQDYYAQIWKQPGSVVESRILRSRQGSGRNLMARSIPTVREGIALGLTPVSTNPIETDLLYATNMGRYLATVNTQKELMQEGLAAFHPVNQQPEGWRPLNGIRAEKPGRLIIQDGETIANQPTQLLYGPADVARVYNNFISKGLEAGDASPLFTAARKATNAVTMLKLGLSAFHATTMANEAVVSDMARGVQSLSRAPGLAARGELGQAGGEIARGAQALVRTPAAPIASYLRGSAMRKELLGLADPSETAAVRNQAYVDAGGRVRMDPLYRARASGSVYNSLMTGTWRGELRDAASRIAGPQGGLRPLDRAGGVVDLGASLIQASAAPLFEHVIPRLKLGAFDSTMSDWMATNPGASPAAVRQAAHLINRSIDNRFGELVWDNVFWHRWMKQASQLVLLSPSWNLGTLNEIGGGVIDAMGPSAKGLVNGTGLTTRTAYVAALAAEVALINGVMTYLKTGTAPHGRDFLAYRTGGVDATSGQPERAMVPGYQKDVYAFGHGLPSRLAKLFRDLPTNFGAVAGDAASVVQRAGSNAGAEIGNKANPALRTTVELTTNKDYRGRPIRNTRGTVTEQAGQVGGQLLDALMPISVGQLAQGRKRGSNISVGEQAAGVRPAPMYVTAPGMVESIEQRQARRAWIAQQRAGRRAAARRGEN